MMAWWNDSLTLWGPLALGALAGAMLWRHGEAATERITDMTPDMVGVHYSQAVDTFRLFWKRSGPVHVVRSGRTQTVQPVEFEPSALYLWVDDDGVVVDGGSWSAIAEPLAHGGVVHHVPAVRLAM